MLCGRWVWDYVCVCGGGEEEDRVGNVSISGVQGGRVPEGGGVLVA